MSIIEIDSLSKVFRRRERGAGIYGYSRYAGLLRRQHRGDGQPDVRRVDLILNVSDGHFQWFCARIIIHGPAGGLHLVYPAATAASL